MGRSLVIDFEGEGKSRSHDTPPAPHMVGVWERSRSEASRYSWAAFKDHWRPIVNGSQYEAHITTITEFFRGISEQMDPEQDRIFHWSDHERLILESYLSIQEWSKIEPFLRNARIAAKKYVRKRGLMDSVKEKTLDDFYQVICPNHGIVPALEDGAANACRRLDNASQSQKRWRQFSCSQKSIAHALIEYNRGDCLATARIIRKIGFTNS